MAKAKIFELLEVILEETNEGSRKLAMNVVKEFDTGCATESMMQLWKTQQRMPLTDEEDKVVEEALEEDRGVKEALGKGLFHGYHILRRLEDYQLC